MPAFKAGLIQLPLDHYEQAAQWANAREDKLGCEVRRASFYPPPRIWSRGVAEATSLQVAALGPRNTSWTRRSRSTPARTGHHRNNESQQTQACAITDSLGHVSEIDNLSSLMRPPMHVKSCVHCRCPWCHTLFLAPIGPQKSPAKAACTDSYCSDSSLADAHLDHTCSDDGDSLESYSSASSTSDSAWAGGLRSCASVSASDASVSALDQLRVKRSMCKQEECERIGDAGMAQCPISKREGDLAEDVVETSFTTVAEFPDPWLSSANLWIRKHDFCDEIAEMSGARVEFDRSRRHGYARVEIAGGWQQSMHAYQLLLHSFSVKDGFHLSCQGGLPAGSRLLGRWPEDHCRSRSPKPATVKDHCRSRSPKNATVVKRVWRKRD